MIKRPALQLQLETERQLWQTSTFEPYKSDQKQLLAEGVKLLIGPHVFSNACFYTLPLSSSPDIPTKVPRRSSLATLQQMLDPQERGKVLQLLGNSASPVTKRETPRRPVWFCLDGPESESFLVPANGTVEMLKKTDLFFSFTLPTKSVANPRIMIIMKGVNEELHRALQDYLRDPVRFASECLPDLNSPSEWNVAFKETCHAFHPPPGLLESLHKAVKLGLTSALGTQVRKRKAEKKVEEVEAVVEKEPEQPVVKVETTLVQVPLKKRKYLPIQESKPE